MLGGQPVRHERTAQQRRRLGLRRHETASLLYCWLLFAVALGAGVLIGWGDLGRH